MARVRDQGRYDAAERAMWAARGIEPREHRVPVGTGAVRVLEHGAGRDVVFVHGTPSAGGMFAPLIEQTRGVRALVVDRPGCGGSDPVDWGRGATALRAAASGFLAATVSALADGPVDLVGSSAGAMPVLLLAATRPDLVRSVTLEGAPAVRGMRLPWHMRAATVAPVASVVGRFPLGEREIRRLLRIIGHGPALKRGALGDEDFAWRVALARDTPTYANDLALMRAVASWRGLRRGWAVGADDLAAVGMPLLWIIGDRDPFASEQRVRDWASGVPSSTVCVRPGEGHMPWIDAPDEHARLLERWWATVPVVVA
ncbi:alpha/beta fold hydrolase [Demequina sp. NBRC 110057]|uniref:alpha/beta fold hydrolase n=1 Tax=Demequina sp. NBRC 110057 TaxID=1570346 RepID=UPI000A0411FF|nr:alpha/beta hydrolase [Demequina sp. NBRC 110057]